MINSEREQALSYLRTHQVMTLATVGKDGVWATAVFYANVNFDLIFLSAEHTRHAQNFEYQNGISVAIQEDYKDWSAIKGIQLSGVVKQLHAAEKIYAIAQYTRKYQFLTNATPQIATALTKVNWYQVTPTQFYFIDNSKGFGYRSEIQL